MSKVKIKKIGKPEVTYCKEERRGKTIYYYIVNGERTNISEEYYNRHTKQKG